MTETLVQDTFTAEQLDDILNGIKKEINEIAAEFQRNHIKGSFTTGDDAMDIFLDVNLAVDRFRVKRGEG